MKVTIIDYGLSNLLSVQHAFARFGAETLLTSDPAEVLRADALVLPGVGAFRDGMAGLEKLGLIEPIRQKAAAGTPLLGICLGMQMLFDESEEFGLHKGLGLSVYSRSDFILDENGQAWCLEINTLPGMTPTSLVPQEAAQVGLNYGELCEKIVELSLAARKAARA